MQDTFTPKYQPANEDLTRSSLVILFLFALAIRIIYIVQSTDNPLFWVPLIDAFVYDAWANEMVRGNWLWHKVENYLPIYPAFLALQKIIFGYSPLVNKIIQSIMGALVAVLMARVAARAWNRPIGLITGYLLATNWMLVVFDAEMFAESFSIFFQAVALWLLVTRPQVPLSVFTAGVAFALSAGTRANLFLVFPVIFGWLLWTGRQNRARAINTAVLFSIGSLLIIGPIVYRNYQISGVPMLRAQGTWSLYSGLSPEFEALHPPVGILFRKHMNMPLQEGLRTEVQFERYWGQKLTLLLTEDVTGVLKTVINRLIIFFNAREWSQEFDVYAYRAYSSFLALPWTDFWVIGPLGVLGLLLVRRPSQSQYLVLAWTIVGIISILPFKGSDRYRLPSVALLSIFAACAIWQLYRWAKGRYYRPCIAALAGLAVLCLLSWPDWMDLGGRKTARQDYFIGLLHESHNRFDDAKAAYQKSMTEFNWDPDSPYRIGHILLKQKQPRQAVDYFKTALTREPQFPEALGGMAQIYLESGKVSDALELANRSLQFNPIRKNTLTLLAAIHRARSDVDAELEFLRRAFITAGDFESGIHLAGRLNELGRHRQALQVYRTIADDVRPTDNVRLTAAMLAGLTASRFLARPELAEPFWQMVSGRFREYAFFSRQADFMLDRISAEKFSGSMRQSPEWEATAAYMIGLKALLAGDVDSAKTWYERSLAIDYPVDPDTPNHPHKWAAEDLAKLIATN